MRTRAYAKMADVTRYDDGHAHWVESCHCEFGIENDFAKFSPRMVKVCCCDGCTNRPRGGWNRKQKVSCDRKREACLPIVNTVHFYRAPTVKTGTTALFPAAGFVGIAIKKLFRGVYPERTPSVTRVYSTLLFHTLVLTPAFSPHQWSSSAVFRLVV